MATRTTTKIEAIYYTFIVVVGGCIYAAAVYLRAPWWLGFLMIIFGGLVFTSFRCALDRIKHLEAVIETRDKVVGKALANRGVLGAEMGLSVEDYEAFAREVVKATKEGGL